MKKSKSSFLYKYPNIIFTDVALKSLDAIYNEYFNKNKEIGYIYGHLSKKTKEWYIGQSVKTPMNRWRIDGSGYSMYNISSKFVSKIKEDGWESFEHYILEFCLLEDLNNKERYYIDEKDSFYNGLNSVYGSGGAYSDTVKRKLKGHKVSEKQIEFIKNLNKGKSSATKGLFVGSSNPMSRAVQMLDFETGEILKEFDTLSDAAKFTNEKSPSNIGKVCRGEREYTKINGKEKVKWIYKNNLKYPALQKLSEEHKKKISESNKGKNSGENSHLSRKVKMYDKDGKFIQEFISMKAAGDFLNVKTSTHISDVCRGKAKTYYGYIWKYADEN